MVDCAFLVNITQRSILYVSIQYVADIVRLDLIIVLIAVSSDLKRFSYSSSDHGAYLAGYVSAE